MFSKVLGKQLLISKFIRVNSKKIIISNFMSSKEGIT